MSHVLTPPPNVPTGDKLRYGRYTIKATSRVMLRNGRDHVHIRGYDVDMSIVDRVDKITKCKACNSGMSHTDVAIEFIWIPIEYPDGTILMDYIQTGKTTKIPWYHKYKDN